MRQQDAPRTDQPGSLLFWSCKQARVNGDTLGTRAGPPWSRHPPRARSAPQGGGGGGWGQEGTAVSAHHTQNAGPDREASAHGQRGVSAAALLCGRKTGLRTTDLRAWSVFLNSRRCPHALVCSSQPGRWAGGDVQIFLPSEGRNKCTVNTAPVPGSSHSASVTPETHAVEHRPWGARAPEVWRRARAGGKLQTLSGQVP